ncbi:MAG: DsbA family protein [Deltaproteobacteria bacterium]|nr:DsbA family protein [Deltaproteobacteria bacterium]MBW2395426.1 DsbA family protein [Deltaproteobacteria bacterium]
MTDSLTIDVFWSFRSPWSYLATPRLAAWQDRYRLEVRFRPVYPIAIRTPEFFDQVHPLWTSYFMTDLQRVAQFLELPIAWPRPDPVIQEMADGRMRTGETQPYIHRLTRLGALAEEEGSGIGFALAVSNLIWTGTENWHEGDHLARASAKAGLDLAALDARAVNEVDRIEAVISQNEADHATAGHWGVPTCAFQGEPFFGQDRLDVLLWRLKQNGLEER